MFLNKQTGTHSIDNKGFDYYMNLAKDWSDPLQKPVIKQVSRYDLFVVDESAIKIGSKARFGDLLFSTVKEKTVVYCQPRFGWAGISLTHLAKRHNKKLVLFMPASREASLHQLTCIENGATPIFRRIAAMPNLNGYAKKYAEEKKAFFIPLGLKHELVTAAIVKVAHELFKNNKPKEMWSVISTGVLTRGLQIALPETKFIAVAVARNIQNGELGKADFLSYNKPFAWQIKTSPVQGLDTALNYDAKGLELFLDYATGGAYFWNVAGEIRPKNLKAEDINSYKNWTDK